MKNITIKAPTVNEFTDVNNFLETEYRQDGNGFYSNIGMILKGYEADKVRVAVNPEGDVLGFSLATPGEGADIISVRKNLRNKGVGTELAQDLEARAYQQRTPALLIQTVNESEGFWEKMGFIPCPERDYNNTGWTFMFKSLVWPNIMPIHYEPLLANISINRKESLCGINSQHEVWGSLSKKEDGSWIEYTFRLDHDLVVLGHFIKNVKLHVYLNRDPELVESFYLDEFDQIGGYVLVRELKLYP